MMQSSYIAINILFRGVILNLKFRIFITLLWLDDIIKSSLDYTFCENIIVTFYSELFNT